MVGVMPWLVIHMMREIRLGGVKEGRAENKKLNENHIREARHKSRGCLWSCVSEPNVLSGT